MTKQRKAWLLLVTILLLAHVTFWNCASQKRISPRQTEIDNLRRELKFYKDQNSQFQRQLNDLTSRIADLELTNRQNKADLATQVDELRQRMEALQNLVQDTNYRITDLNKKSRPPRGTTARYNPAPEDTSTSPQSRRVDASRELYNTAYRDLIRGNYQLALQGFRQFIQLYPNSDLTDNAQYWVGEVYYAQGRYPDAIEEYEKVRRWYKNGDKVAAALLKIGFAYISISEIEQGKLYLEEVIEDHPQSEEANLARGRLASLN